MKASAANFLSIIKGPKQFVIPIYQRTYSWQISQCQKLFEDILRISRDDSVPGHFIGSIVYFQEGIHTQADVPQLLVIDGRQRLTTITLLIAAIADFVENNETEIDTTAVKLRNYYLMNSEEDGDLRFKLLLTRRDKETIINILKKVPLGSDISLRVQAKYLHTLGNLTLTGYNSELSDRPFSEKKTIVGGFNDSPIRLNERLRTIDVWNEEQILNRAIQLAEKARKVWRAPKLPTDALAKYKRSETRENAVYTIDDHEHLKGEMLDLFNVLRKRILNFVNKRHWSA